MTVPETVDAIRVSREGRHIRSLRFEPGERVTFTASAVLDGRIVPSVSASYSWETTLGTVDTGRIGMWGISLGGAYTMFTLPLEPRIKAGIVTAWFNHRVKKMAIDDPRYSCFLSVQEEHIFIPGWLREFTDSDLASLICPRALMSQTGKGDGIAWWPFVEDEFAATKAHYQKLGVADKVQLDLHEGGHEIRVATGLDFLRKWL